jgi:flavorubredoxin
LILDKEPTLIDSVRAPYAGELLENIEALCPLADIRWVVCNHAEPDHSGALPAIMKACPNAKLVCDAKCRKTLELYYETAEWTFHLVKTGETLSIGERTLEFVETPMAHWPESMATWLPQDRLLFSMDAFGQHYATNERFCDDVPQDILMFEAKTYVANILMLYTLPVSKAVEAVRQLAPLVLAPSHGLIWRGEGVETILSAYDKWDKCTPQRKVLVLYDTMWKSTELMALAIVEGAVEEAKEAVDVKLLRIPLMNRTQVVTEVLDAAAFAVGTPTLNQTMLPTVADVMTYLKGLRPSNKAGFAFGSYGWSRGGPEEVEGILQGMKVDLLRPLLKANFKPSEELLGECREAGRLLVRRALDVASA